MTIFEKPSPNCSDEGYYRYEVVGDNTCIMSRAGTRKVVYVKKVPVRGVTLTVGIFFDGTGNNWTNGNDLRIAYGNCSNMVGEERAKACEKYEQYAKDTYDNASYRCGITNITRLYNLYQTDDELNNQVTQAQIKIYIPGIGTANGKSDSLIGMALGSSLIKHFEGVVTKTDEVMDKISTELAKFIKQNSGQIAIAKVQFDLFGFSRGAASARHFANRVMKQDPLIAEAITRGLELSGHHGEPAGEVRFLGLFDTVAAIGSLLNFYDINGRSNPGVELELRPSVAQKVFQISAMHECRYNFSLNSIKGIWPELALPGAHADIGGGYNSVDSFLPENEDILLTMPDFEVVSEDVDEKQTKVYVQTELRRERLFALPALKYILPHGKIETRVVSWHLVNPNKARASIFEKKVGAAVFFERQAIPNDWEKVCMRVMLDAAEEAGANFQDIDPLDPDMSICDELISFSNKAIAQGRAVRCGKTPMGFTAEEMQVIGKYMHCSANWNVNSDRSLWLNPKNGEIFLPSKIAAMDERPFVWANAPGDGWIRSVWKMDDQQQWEERSRKNSDALDQIF